MKRIPFGMLLLAMTFVFAGCSQPKVEPKDEPTTEAPSTTQTAESTHDDSQAAKFEEEFAVDSLSDTVALGKPAPDFSIKDENGEEWKLSDYKGQVVVLDFWGFW
ncbi:MAG: redoxin domain-containing protein [Armatimonadetes bacterium]|nr:redoxin domain-containing protein [Armatimonadota bacterium]